MGQSFLLKKQSLLNFQKKEKEKEKKVKFLSYFFK